MPTRTCPWWSAGIVLALAASAAAGGELPPSDGKPLSELVKSLEDAGVGVITSIEFDDGVWEVQTHKDGKWVELHVDPRTGEIKRRQPDEPSDDMPPADGKALSTILKDLEGEKPGVITSVEFDDGYWEVKVRQGDRKIKIDIDPRTGKRRR